MSNHSFITIEVLLKIEEEGDEPKLLEKKRVRGKIEGGRTKTSSAKIYRNQTKHSQTLPNQGTCFKCTVHCAGAECRQVKACLGCGLWPVVVGSVRSSESEGPGL